jgi:hypothetical protein
MNWLKAAWYFYLMMASVNLMMLLLLLDPAPGIHVFDTKEGRQLYVNLIVDSALWPALWAGTIKFEDPRHSSL